MNQAKLSAANQELQQIRDKFNNAIFELEQKYGYPIETGVDENGQITFVVAVGENEEAPSSVAEAEAGSLESTQAPV